MHSIDFTPFVLYVFDVLIRKNLVPSYVCDRIWFADNRNALGFQPHKSYRLYIGKGGFQINFKYSVVGYYFQAVPF